MLRDDSKPGQTSIWRPCPTYRNMKSLPGDLLFLGQEANVTETIEKPGATQYRARGYGCTRVQGLSLRGLHTQPRPGRLSLSFGSLPSVRNGRFPFEAKTLSDDQVVETFLASLADYGSLPRR